MKKLVSIIISVYNEERNVEPLYKELRNALNNFNIIYELIFVNDGSSDLTLENLLKIAKYDQNVKIVNLLRNFGHEIAMTAGIDYAKGDGILFMDGDFQHPPAIVPKIIQEWLNGHSLVLTKAIQNKSNSIFKNLSRKLYYKIIDLLSDTKIKHNTPDFRLIDRKYIEILKQMKEKNRLFRGMVDWLSIKNIAIIDFYIPERLFGKTHYNFHKLIDLAINSIVQFSTKPLRFATYIGIISGFLMTVFVFWTIVEHYLYSHSSSGYATIICIAGFSFSINMIILGIIGEYVAKIHIQSQDRPLYFAEFIEFSNDTKE